MTKDLFIKSYMGLLLFVCCFFLNSCQPDYQKEILSFVELTCPELNDSSLVSFDKAFSFNWEKVYVFQEMESPDYISEAIGFELGIKVPEDRNLWVMVDKQRVLGTKVTLRSSRLWFVDMYMDGYIVIDKSSTYLVKKKMIYGEPKYILTHPCSP